MNDNKTIKRHSPQNASSLSEQCGPEARGEGPIVRASLVILILVVAARGSLRAEEAECTAEKTSDAKSLRDFLVEQERLRQSPCLPSVIKRLGQLHDEEAIHLLVSFLDYMDPKTAPLPNGGATVRPAYPAVSALFLIGKPASVELISAIQGGETPNIRKNAVRAYASIYRDDLSSGVQRLKLAGLVAKNDDQRRNLNEAREKLLFYCNSGSEKQAKACAAVN